MSKKKWMGLISVVVTVAAIVGMMVIPAMADEEEPVPNPGERCEKFIGKVADNLGVTVDELKAATSDAAMTTIDEAVADGLITQERADQIKQRIEEAQESGMCGIGIRGFGPKGMRGFGLEGMRGACDPAQMAEKIATAVESGKITQEQADAIIQRMEENGGAPSFGKRGFGGMRGGPRF